MSKDRMSATPDLAPLIGGYPAWMLGLPECRQVRGTTPERGRWVKILHGLRGTRGESTWGEVLRGRSGGVHSRVGELDLEVVDESIERYPEKGTLGENAWKAVRAAVQGCGLETRCFVWMEPYRMDPPHDACWRTSLAAVPEVVDIPENYYGGGPHAVWATDESWFVVSDVDLPFSIVACSVELCERLLSEPCLEALEVRGDDPLA